LRAGRRARDAIAAAAFAAASAGAAAHASGHTLNGLDDGAMWIAVAPYLLLAASPWIVSLWTLRGPAGVGKALFGLVTCLAGTLVAAVLLGGDAETTARTPAWVFAGVLLGVQLIRLGLAVVRKARSGPNKEKLKRLWRYL
jgi:hypothetical protein